MGKGGGISGAKKSIKEDRRKLTANEGVITILLEWSQVNFTETKRQLVSKELSDFNSNQSV